MARILLAEDQASLRQFIERALVAVGHELESVSDGSDALDRLGQETYDLLLADIVMPQMDGIALALRAGLECPNLKILLMTGFASELQRAHNLEALIHGVVVKPFTLKALRQEVNKALSASIAA